MTLVLVLVALAYSLVGSYFWRRWTWEQEQGPWEHSEAMIWALLMALVWPAVCSWNLIAAQEGFALPPREVRSREREERLQERVAELERQVGIR